MTTLIVNRFEQCACKTRTAQLRGQIRAAANIRLKEILKKGALTVKRTVVHLSTERSEHMSTNKTKR